MLLSIFKLLLIVELVMSATMVANLARLFRPSAFSPPSIFCFILLSIFPYIRRPMPESQETLYNKLVTYHTINTILTIMKSKMAYQFYAVKNVAPCHRSS